MRSLRLMFVLALSLGAALAVAACGGDDSPEQQITVASEPTETESAEGALSKADFIAQADPICEEANTQIQAFADAGQGLTEADEIAALRAGVVADLNALGPPTEDRETLDQFLAAMQATAEAGEKIALASERGTDTAQFETELQASKDEAATAGSAYGFQSCGSDVTSSTSTAPADGTAVPSEPVAPVTPAPAPDSGGGSTDDGGSDGSSGGVSPGGGGVSPG